MPEGAPPGRARIVVVGGGIIGCSIAYHLAQLGMKDTVLVERKRLTSGTTWHAAGLVIPLRPSRRLTELGHYGIDLFARLEEETGQATGFKKNGRLLLALQEARLEVLRRTASHAHYLGVEAKLVETEQVADFWPLLDLHGVLGGLLLPTHGQVNPVDVTLALAKGARMNGVQLFENTEVVKILTRGGKTTGVETDRGTIEAGTVVLACGMWTRSLAATLGVNVPLHAAEHFYLVTNPIENLHPDTPSLGLADEHAYYKEDAGKLLIGCFEEDAKPWASHGIPESFEFGSLQSDLVHYEEFLEAALARVPALERTGIRTFFTGPESFTPDGRPLIGAAPELRGLFVCAGFCSTGIASAAPAGRIMAEWIRDAHPPSMLMGHDVRRMIPFQGTRRYLFDRTTESMGLTHAIPWPGRQPRTARNIRRGPLHEVLVRAGANMGERAGWEVPLWYSRPDRPILVREKMGQQDWFPLVREECLATRDAVALYEQSFMSKFLVQGPDACRTLNWISANDVDVPPGRVVYTQWLNANGTIEADLTVNRWAEDVFLVVTLSSSQVRDRDWFVRQTPGDARVTVTDVTSGYAQFSVTGPRSRALLQSLSDVDLANDAFSFGTSGEIDIGYVRARATRITFVGELGYELMMPTEVAAYVYEQLATAGEALELRHAGLFAQSACRLERGYRSFGHDIGDDDTPLSAGLGFAVAWDKPGGFLGRDALQKARTTGRLPSRLVQIALHDASAMAPVLEHNEPIWRDGRRVGLVTSGGWGFRTERSLGMGYVFHDDVTAEWLRAGDFEVEIACERYPVTVQLRPFYDPTGERIRM